MTISLFGYENPALPGLLDAWAHSANPVTCLVPEGRLVPEVQGFFGHRKAHMQRGHLEAILIPFVPQADYDALLWLCDLNFVRGEDSFVRAQWAARPMVWHIYPQAERAHLAKLAAFLDRYLAGLPPLTAAAAQDFWAAWNEQGDAGALWPAFAASLPALGKQARTWPARIAANGDLATNLLDFARGKANK